MRAGRAALRALPALVGLLACADLAPERIVLVVVDTLRRDALPAYGGTAPTPRLHELAARGRVYHGALASFHQTSMSMASLFTGRTPSIESRDGHRPLFWNGESWCGLARFAGEPAPGSCVPPELPTLAERLREGGFATIGVASNQLLHEPSGFAAGFDDWVEVGGSPGPDGGRALVHWRQVNRAAFEALARRSSDRFFLYVHYMDVHDYELRRRGYAEPIPEVDRAVGGLLDHLRGRGLLDGASVIFTSDHGEHLGEAHPVRGGRSHLGNPSYLEVLRVPLIAAPPLPERIAPGPDAPVRTQDLYYWILALAGMPAGGVEELGPGELFVGEMHYRTLLTGRWKSSMRRDDGSLVLFDLEADPDETLDVSGQHPEVVRHHRERGAALARALGAQRDPRGALSARDRVRLRALGYLE